MIDVLFDLMRGLLGIFVLILICYLLSVDRERIDWKLVFTGIGLQFILGILVLKVPFIKPVFDTISGFFVKLLEIAEEGTKFILGEKLLDPNTFEYVFAFKVLPTVIFFSALTSLLYYLGILQRIVFGFAWIMSRTMRLSGAESLAAAGNIFVGQTEAPLLIKPYLTKMTDSEIMCLMVGGFATIAGGVFAAYVGYLGGTDSLKQQYFATHLLTASILSAPAAIVAAKMLFPETQTINEKLEVPKAKIGVNALDAIANGTIEGTKLAINVGVMLLVFIAMISLVNYILKDFIGGLGNNWGNNLIQDVSGGKYDGFTLQYIFGVVFAPVAWVLGVPGDDILVVGQLLGEKTIINEFVAYVSLGKVKTDGTIIHEKSIIIATYALCGFANLPSIGIQIGGIGALAPDLRPKLARLSIRALIGGTIAAFFTATIAGIIYQW